jgi:hypothetical protein
MLVAAVAGPINKEERVSGLSAICARRANRMTVNCASKIADGFPLSVEERSCSGHHCNAEFAE